MSSIIPGWVENVTTHTCRRGSDNAASMSALKHGLTCGTRDDEGPLHAPPVCMSTIVWSKSRAISFTPLRTKAVTAEFAINLSVLISFPAICQSNAINFPLRQISFVHPQQTSNVTVFTSHSHRG